MLGELSWKQFAEWEAYDNIEPIGGVRGDWQAASICSLLANITAAQAKSRRRFSTKDFLLEFSDEAKDAKEAPTRPVYTQTWQEQKLIGMMYAAAFNYEEDRKKAKKRS